MHLTYSFYLCYLKQTISSIVFIIMFMYFQGFKDHKLYDPLENPGSADLTADVDFSYLKRCCGEDGNAVLILIYNSHFSCDNVAVSDFWNFEISECKIREGYIIAAILISMRHVGYQNCLRYLYHYLISVVVQQNSCF